MTLPHSAQINHTFFGKNEVNVKITKANPPPKRLFGIIESEIRTESKKSRMSVDIANVWQEIEIRVDPDPF